MYVLYFIIEIDKDSERMILVSVTQSHLSLIYTVYCVVHPCVVQYLQMLLGDHE